MARWLGGGGPTIDWLLAHPEWCECVDICSIAHEQATAEKQRRDQEAMSALG